MKHGKNRYAPADGWPQERQKLLLRAAFLADSNQVCSLWKEWQSHNDWNRIDHASKKILPVVINNVQKHGAIIDPDVKKNGQKLYFENYIQNQRIFTRAAKLIHQLHQAGFKTMLLKGTPLAIQYYKKSGLRFMSDVDVLIPTAEALDCIAHMRKLGWRPVSREPEKFTPDYVAVSHGHEFYHPDGGGIDLHWHVMHECCLPDSDMDFWEAAIPLDFLGISTNSLNPADQLLHTCVHSSRFGSSIPLRSLVDVMIIIDQSPSDLDWHRLIRQATKRKLVLPVRETLFYVSTYLRANIPEHVLKQFRMIPVAKHQQIEYAYKRQDYRQKRLGYFPVLFFDYLRLRHHMGLWEYLRRFWGTPNHGEALLFLYRTMQKGQW